MYLLLVSLARCIAEDRGNGTFHLELCASICVPAFFNDNIPRIRG